MVTNPTEKPEPLSNAERLGEATYYARERLEAAARIAVTGDSTGRLRRNVLYLILGACVIIDVQAAQAIAIIALLLLALTDAVVEL